MALKPRPLAEELAELREERLVREKAGKLPREIERQHRFPINERPDDDDAHPDSGWLYAKEWEVAPPPPAGPRINPKRGPKSGIPCFMCGQDTYVVDELNPGDILSYVEGNREKRVIIKNPDGIAILFCENNHQTQMRVSLLPTKSALLWTP